MSRKGLRLMQTKIGFRVRSLERQFRRAAFADVLNAGARHLQHLVVCAAILPSLPDTATAFSYPGAAPHVMGIHHEKQIQVIGHRGKWPQADREEFLQEVLGPFAKAPGQVFNLLKWQR